MRAFKLWGTYLLIALFSASCGDGSSVSGGGSGIGGTGISLVKGNIAVINGQQISFDVTEGKDGVIVFRLVSPINFAFAQSGLLGDATISGGGQTANIQQNGTFSLNDVEPDPNFILSISIPGTGSVTLAIGEVKKGNIVSVEDISIDTNNGTATPGNVSVTEPESTANTAGSLNEDDVSEDNNSADDEDSNDDISEDNDQDDVSEDDNSSDDTSEGGESDDDSQDDDSDDDT